MGAVCCLVERKDAGWEVCCLASKDGEKSPRRDIFAPAPATPPVVKAREIDLGDLAPAGESRPTTIASSEAGDEGPSQLTDPDSSSTSIEPETAVHHQAHVERLSLIASLLQNRASGSASTGRDADDPEPKGEEGGVAEGPPPSAPDSSPAAVEPEQEPEHGEHQEQVERLSLLASLLETRASGTAPTSAGESEATVAEAEAPTPEGKEGGEGDGGASACDKVRRSSAEAVLGEAGDGPSQRRSRITSGPAMTVQFGLATTFFLSHDVHRLRMHNAKPGASEDQLSVPSPDTAAAAHADGSRQERGARRHATAPAEVTADPAQILSF